MGSLLIGSRSFVAQARRLRKAFGGGMRQAGYLAAAGIYALDHHVDRLREDNQHARLLGQALEELSFVAAVRPVQSNIVIFDLVPGLTAAQCLQALAAAGIRASAFGPATIRFVTHLDVSGEDIALAIARMRAMALNT